VKWKNKKMVLQMLWTKADEVSKNDELESIEIIFWGKKWFIDKKNGTPV
jgi:hypothetical protein